jgi:hypothetical protein
MHQDQIKWLPSPLAKGEKALADGSSEIAFPGGAHVRLSK